MNALVKGQAAPAAGHSQYLTFSLQGELFAIGILAIKEIIEYGGLTTVPMMPSCIRGVINLRGAVVPVLDLALRFGRPASEVTRRTCIVIVELQGEEGAQVVGLVVDAVSAVVEIPPTEIEPPPSFGARIRADFIEGMGKHQGGFVILVNVDRVMALEDLAEIGRLTDSAQAQPALA